MQNSPLDRRQWLKVAGLAGASALWTGRRADADAPAKKRAIRIAHLADVHVEPERAAGKGMAACLDHVHAQVDKPELILFGGDCVYESMHHDLARTQSQWDLWHATLEAHCTIPAQFCIGNHDVWGWGHAKAKTNGNEPLYGKKMPMHQLGLEQTYHSFDKGGWHFVILDSIFPNGDTYQARLDDAQFEWLTADLAKVDPKTPVLVLSHIPILSVTPMLDPKATTGTDTTVSGGGMHEDFRKIGALFRKFPNVKVAMSGHTQLIDRVDHLGVSYLCNGAVSGDWWKGNHLGECEPGYAIIDLFEDGSFEQQYLTYGWKAVPGEDVG